MNRNPKMKFHTGRKKAIGVCLLAAFVIPSLTGIEFLTAHTYAQEEEILEGQLHLDGLGRALERIPEVELREASLAMLTVLSAYEAPSMGLAADDGTLSVEICLWGRRVFCYYERLQTRRGIGAALEIRSPVRGLFQLAEARLQWIANRELGPGVFNSVRGSISTKAEALMSDDPIPLAQLNRPLQD